jgi:cell division protein FtsB
MWKKIQERVFPFIIATSALSVSASAAFYSISGLSKLFAGAAFAVIIMATSLEVAKLVIASLLYQYRKSLPLLLKSYLSVACFVLILITSMGIYGFLSAAYQETAAKAGSIDSQIALIETKRDNVREQLAVYNAEKSSINTAVSDLRSGLSNNKIQYRDRETGQIITTTSSSTRRALEKQLDQAILRQTEINTKVDNLNEQLFEYETEIVEVKTGNDIAGELGPLKYLSGLTGTPMDKIINYLLLIIIFVFDPLAIALVIAANYAFERLQPKKTRNNIYGEKVVIEEDTPVILDEDEFDEDHALDTVLNNIVSDEDWRVVDDEKPFDVEEHIKEINKSKLSAYGKKKAIRKVKKDNLTKIY